MKKLFSLLIAILLVASVIAQSPPQFPFLIDGKITINGVRQIEGYEVKIENLNTGDAIYNKVRNGAYFYNLNNLPNSYFVKQFGYSGHVIRITACGGHPDCIYEFEIVSTNPQRHDFVIDSELLPTRYVCPDSTIVDDPDDCIEEEIVDKVTEDEDAAIVEAYYGQPINIIVADNKLGILKDTKINFDGDDYDIEEKFYFKGIILTSIDDEDFGSFPYLTIAEGDVKYQYIFNDLIELDDINEDESLIIEFLGKEIEIIEADTDEITIVSGKEYLFDEGETIEGITVKTIGEDFVYVIYNGVGEKIEEGEIELISDLEFYVVEVLSDEDVADFASIIIGENVKSTVSDGDDFELFVEDEELWKWDIKLPDYIGIYNQEEYMELDEDTMPFTVGEGLGLPNDYISVLFESVTESEVTEIKFRSKDGYLIAEGDILDDYDKLYIRADGIYDDDNEEFIGTEVRIADSDTFLELGSVLIGKLEIKLDLSDILYDGISYLTKDETYLDYFGIIFTDPEDAIEEQKGFEVTVPEERPEAKLRITSDVVVKPIPIEPVEPIEPEPVPVEPIIPVTPVTPITPVEPPVEPIKFICEDGTEVTDKSFCPIIEPIEPEVSTLYKVLIGLAIVVLGIFGWGKGFAGLANYYFKKGEELEKQGKKAEAKKMYDRAAKMLTTAMKKAQEGKYK